MKEQLLEVLKRDAWFKGVVTLASGKTSDFYIDVRRVSLSSEGIYLISRLVWDIIKKEDITAIGGPTLGADPIVGAVCALAHQEGKNLKGFLIRKTPKAHGRQQLIEGKELNASDKVVVIDDVATSGGSFLKAIEVLRQSGVNVKSAITVVDRQEGAKENLAKAGCPLIALLAKSDFR